MSRFGLWARLGVAMCVASPAAAATDADLEEIRAQIRELKAGYESRIKALEDRLKEAEIRVAQPPPVASPAAPPSRSTSASAFNPAISAILGGHYANLSRDPERFRIGGFATGGEAGPGRRGFSLGESELQLSANVDHRFSGNLIFAVSPENTIEVEEAYGIATAMPGGFTPKFGRFLSAQGYLNEQHAHAWDFVDAPLVYQAFFGGAYRTDGAQLKWLAPLDHYVELGAEWGSGESFPGTARSRNGAGSSVVYARTGGDVGASHSWLAGVSFLATRAQDRVSAQLARSGNEAQTAFTGRSRVAVADLVWKYAPNGNARETNLKLQGEYFWRKEDGHLAFDSDGLLGLTNDAQYESRQSGWYAQGVYQFMPQWRAGVRYDRLNPGQVNYGANAAFLEATSFHPKRSSVMVDWSPSEFSRFRLQFAQAKTAAGVTDNEWFVQYILSLGAHGAHKY